MADITKRAPIGIVEHVLVKIDKFLFPSDFVVIDMLKMCNETMIIGRPFLATIHVEIDVFNKEISLRTGDDRVNFDMDKKIHNYATPLGKVYMVNSIHNDAPPNLLDIFQEDCKPKPRDYPFKEWLLAKVGHTNVSEPIKKPLLKSWLIDCFREELVKDPRSRSFDDYKWVFDLEINQLADKYELRIGNKGHMCDDIRENYKKLQGDNTHWGHNHGLEEEEGREIRANIKEYDPPKVQDTLPLGRENGSRFREMIRKELDTRGGRRKTISQQGDGIRGHIDSYSCGKDVAVLEEFTTSAFEQETQDLDVEIKQMKDLKASYSVITPQELRRNQINEKISHHHSYGVTALSQLRRNLHLKKEGLILVHSNGSNNI
ncbi:BYPASS-related protein [Tanacetum coccineum]|uniref:BYPASS-related protein n=1 Tax=Tanacetum coccineum TaxID=301880 RepID=A0ABQ5GDG1_9ASTR